MNAKKFSDALSEVNDKYYEEAANYHCKKHGWVKFTSLAACAAIVADFSVFNVQLPYGLLGTLKK